MAVLASGEMDSTDEDFLRYFSGESCNGIFDITWWGVSCRIEYTYVYLILHTHISHIISNMKKTRIRYYMCIFDYIRFLAM